MREKYEHGVKLLYEYLIPYNETEETLLGFTSIFEGLERHAKLQIEILNRCDDKLDVELPNEPSKEEIKEESLQGLFFDFLKAKLFGHLISFWVYEE